MVTFPELKSRQVALGVVGLGYVGLPLAVALARHFKVIGFDVKESRITELKAGFDRTREVAAPELGSIAITYTTDPVHLAEAQFIIIAVPTPVDERNVPDLTLVEKATEMVGKYIAPGSIVVYESTVYPGVTEDICLPILQKQSGLIAGRDFKVGYSPERINPGDHEHTIDKVIKVVAGMDTESTDVIAQVYGTITTTFRAASIKVAEAAKVIENTQRDLNIALMNELTVIFHKMNISVYDVLTAAGTKWNFLPFQPGLVGGHCIGVDPYYLTYKAQQLGYEPEVILAGRKINDSMGAWIIGELLSHPFFKDRKKIDLKVLVCGMTFKENIPDVRNSKVFDMIQALRHNGIEPVVYDPVADRDEVQSHYGVSLSDWPSGHSMDVIIVAVAHEVFSKITRADWQAVGEPTGALFADIKHILPPEFLSGTNLTYWSL